MKPSLHNDWRDKLPMLLLMLGPVLYLAAVLASGYEDGMNIIELMGRFAALVERPFSLRWTGHTLKFMLVAVVAYGVTILFLFSTKENKRTGEEHGSARWGSARQLDRKYRDKDPERNTVLTQHVSMSLDGRKHRRNLLQIVVGGSGSGKTRFFAKPNLMEANCSYVVCDPKGEMLRSIAPLLLEKGYVVKVFDLIDTKRSNCFNPFAYLHDDKDVMKMVNNLIKNTTPKDAQQNDPFWERSEIALDTAIILYLIHEAPPEEQTLDMVLYMLNCAGASEEDESYQSPLDLLFEALEDEEPDHVAVREYQIFKQAEGRTAKSILITAAVRLSAFILPEINRITSHDELELHLLGERKQAVFCVIPDNDSTFSFLVGMLYTCTFQSLYYRADKLHQGGLPVPVRLMMDEFCNVALPDEFGKIQATMRSRNIMSTIILQNISALKALYKNEWEGLLGNADTMLYLGGNEQSTHKYISEMLGKQTIKVQSSGQTKGRNGSMSINYQTIGRELMTPDEVRAMDNRYALLFIRGEYPVMDQKLDILKHRNLKYTEDGGAAPYVHRPDADYTLDDLAFVPENIETIEIIDDLEE